jgi:hypothetical protein
VRSSWMSNRKSGENRLMLWHAAFVIEYGLNTRTGAEFRSTCANLRALGTRHGCTTPEAAQLA